MKNPQYQRCSMMVLLLSLLIHSCQQSHLQVRDEDKTGESEPVSSGTLGAPAKGLQTSLKYPVADTSTYEESNEKILDDSVANRLPSRKLPATALSHDTEEKKESPR